MVDADGVTAGGAPLRLSPRPGVRMAFSGRGEGNLSGSVGPQEEVAAARGRLAGLVDLEAADLVVMEQVHGPGVAVVGLGDVGRGAVPGSAPVPGVDALVTADPDVGLVVLVADCVPLLLAAPGGVAAVHAGRAGVASGIVGAAVTVLADVAGAAPADLAAVVGPAIGGCCYEVPRELQVDVAARVRAASATTTWGTPSLDLPAAVDEQLRAAGVVDVAAVGGCTRCEAGTWFSHRATTGHGAAEGRQAGIVRRGARMDAPPQRSTAAASLDSR
jgi:polyphenol oxidase